MKRRTRILAAVGVLTSFSFGLVWGFRAELQTWLDRQGLADYAAQMVHQDVGPPPRVFDLRQASPRLGAPTRSNDRPEVELDGVVAETWVFDSPVADGAPGRATFWVYRQSELGARPAVIWLPGNGFGPLAYPLVRGFYTRILDAGWDLVIWVPPYHVSREGAGGRGILTANTSDNLRVLYGSVAEIRTMAAFLRGRGVTKLGGWGGSMGAAIVWLASSLERFDFLSLMIPVLDWRSVTLRPDEMAPLTAKIEAAGTSMAQLDAAYEAVSPVAHASLTPGTAIQIQYAAYDQLTPARLTQDFAHQRGVMALQSYPRGHATILLTPELYEDFGEFLRRR